MRIRKIQKSFAIEEIEKFVEWTLTSRKEFIYRFQEMTLNILRVILTEEFKKDIAALREEYDIPNKWQASDYEEKYDEWLDWLENGAPFTSSDSVIIDICKKYNLKPSKYAEFIRDYLYFGNPLPYLPEGDFIAIDESKNRTRFDMDLGKGHRSLKLRIYKNTTKNGLIDFINKNWKTISDEQKYLDEYPTGRTQKEQTFKRDLFVYLLYCKGENYAFIQRFIAKNFKDEPEKFIPLSSTIRKIISEFNKNIASSADL